MERKALARRSVTRQYLGAAAVLILLTAGALAASFRFAPGPAWVWLLHYGIAAAIATAAVAAGRRAGGRAEGAAELARERLRRLEEAESERDGARRSEAEQRAWFEAVLRGAGDAVIATDAHGRIVLFNEAAEAISGWSAAEAAQREARAVVQLRSGAGDGPADLPADQVLREGPAAGLRRRVAVRARDGRVVPAEAWAVPVRAPGGRLLGAVLVVQDMTAREAAERALEQAAAETERFAYIASHDLEEPLRSVTSFAALLKRHYGDSMDPRAADYLRFIIAGAGRMSGLIQDLFAYSRAGSQNIADVSSEAALAESLSALHSAIESSGSRITHGPLPVVQADPGGLAQVFQHLIGNAIKFRGARNPEIHVAAEKQDGCWMFTVRDNGIGFDPKHSARIFAMFQRLHPGDAYPGSGAGLAIAKRIVESHRGSIWADSKCGEGSTFSFTLPELRAHKAAGA